MQDILINWTPQETRVAVIEHGAVQDLHVERTLERGLVGNIYAGRVARVLPGMQSAFIDIGLERAAFLHVADVQVPGDNPRNASAGGATVPPLPIERLVFEGQTMTVQVVKDPIGTKGARLSTQISALPAACWSILPQEKHIGISARSIEAEAELRERLREKITEPGAPARWRADRWLHRPHHGRGMPPTRNSPTDIAYLRKTWAAISASAASRTSGPPVHVLLSGV